MEFLHLLSIIFTLSLVYCQINPSNRQNIRNVRNRDENIYFPDEIEKLKMRPPVAKSNAIPMELLNRINKIESLDEFIKDFIVKNSTEIENPVLASRFSDVERSAATKPKFAICQADITVVPLKPDNYSNDPSVISFPTCTRVKRCGGCCLSPLLSCQPTKTEIIPFQVDFNQYVGDNKFKKIGGEIVQIEQHTECKCLCRIKQTDCNQFQTYVQSGCNCICTNHDDENKCERDNNLKIWDASSCLCKCRETKDCTTGTYFDLNQCQCISYVLNVTPDLPNVFEGSGRIQYLQIPITDHYSQDLAGHFPVAIRFIDEARRKGSAVLVHCLAGVSRSVTVTLAYLMHTSSLCLNDAFSLVRARKPDVLPNFHFMEQLHSFERQLKTDPNRTPLSTSTLTSDILATSFRTQTQTTTGGGGGGDNNEKYSRPSKYSCACLQVECKCMQTDFLGHTPDSGIEFDTWTPGVPTSPK